MAEGPDVAGEVAVPPEPEPPEHPGDAATILEAIAAARNTIVGAVLFASLLIVVTLLFMRCSDPYQRCKSLWEANTGPGGSWSDAEWEESRRLECQDWPGIG